MKRRSFILSALSLYLFSFDLKAGVHPLDTRDNNLESLKARIHKDKMELNLLLSQLAHENKSFKR